MLVKWTSEEKHELGQPEAAFAKSPQHTGECVAELIDRLRVAKNSYRFTLTSERGLGVGEIIFGSLGEERSPGTTYHKEANLRVRRVLAVGTAAAILSVGAAAPTALAAATESTTVTDVPIPPFVVTNPCNGDVVTITTGFIHLVLHYGTSAAGGELVSGESNTQDVSGTDAAGIKYHEIGVGTEAQVFTAPGGEAATGTDNIRLVSQTATVPNFDERILFHVTINADGTETSSVENGGATCQS